MGSAINIGIVGYGNLGKAAEQEILTNPRFNLVAIFSRRQITSPFGTKTEAYGRFKDYIGQIDVMLLCGGSKSDLEAQTPEIAKYFNVINTFDTHSKIPQEVERIDAIGKENGTVALLSCGWDPGLFSVVRTLFSAVGGAEPVTFWGKGVSMGHSDAIRRVKGVEDGVQFTIPNQDAVRLARFGLLPKSMPLHNRECYVAARPEEQTRIEHEIKEIPSYFKGQPTKVHFVDKREVERLKAKMFHKGQVITSFKTAGGNKCSLNFSVSMQSNPEFTASIMCAYISAVLRFREEKKFGAYTTLDIPVSYLFSKEERMNIIKHLC